MGVRERIWMVGLTCLSTVVSCQTTKENADEWANPEVVNVPLGADGLKRLTAEQYNNTVVDIFPSAGLEAVVFPFELDVDGFDNNTAVNTATPTLVETYFDAGFVVAGTVARAAENVLPCDPVTAGCAKRYLVETARRAWRRDLTPEEQRSLELQFDQDVALYDWPGALELGIAYLLQVPDFLYFP